MAIERKTVIDQIEISRTGEMRVRLGLLLIEDGEEIDCKWHRTVLDHDTDPATQVAAVNAHLTQMGKKPVSPEDVDKLQEYHTLYKDIARRGAPVLEAPVTPVKTK